MKSTLLKTLLAASVLVASASATIIDNFNNPIDQKACIENTGSACGPTPSSSSSSGLPLGETIGGYRGLLAAIAGGTGNVVISVNGTTPGSIDIAASSGVDPSATVYYLGAGGIGGPVDLIGSGENLFHVRYHTDNGYTMIVNLNGTLVPVSLDNTTAGFHDVYVNLSAWGAGLNSVSTAILSLTGSQAGSDLNIDLIETTTPEPMTFAMMGAGLLALGALRLRKRS